MITTTTMADVVVAGVIKLNPTHQKYCPSHAVIKDYDHWTLALRPNQATLGAGVIVAKCTPDILSVGALSAAAGVEFLHVVADFERALRAAFGASKFNYICLMMVDLQPHFHAIPRYEHAPTFLGQSYVDLGWPKMADLQVNVLDDDTLRPQLIQALRAQLN